MTTAPRYRGPLILRTFSSSSLFSGRAGPGAGTARSETVCSLRGPTLRRSHQPRYGSIITAINYCATQPLTSSHRSVP